jgi:hypothetical protein
MPRMERICQFVWFLKVAVNRVTTHVSLSGGRRDGGWRSTGLVPERPGGSQPCSGTSAALTPTPAMGKTKMNHQRLAMLRTDARDKARRGEFQSIRQTIRTVPGSKSAPPKTV